MVRQFLENNDANLLSNTSHFVRSWVAIDYGAAPARADFRSSRDANADAGSADTIRKQIKCHHYWCNTAAGGEPSAKHNTGGGRSSAFRRKLDWKNQIWKSRRCRFYTRDQFRSDVPRARLEEFWETHACYHFQWPYAFVASGRKE